MKTCTALFVSLLVAGCASHDSKEDAEAPASGDASEAKTYGVAEADPAGVDAYLPNINELVYKGMPKAEVIRLFRRYPDYQSDEGRTIGWMYNLLDGKKVFSLRLSFDAFDRALGLDDQGLEICVFTGLEKDGANKAQHGDR